MLWSIATGHALKITLRNPFRQSFRLVNNLKQPLNKSNYASKVTFKLRPLTKIGLGLTTGCIIHVTNVKIACCQTKNRLTGYKIDDVTSHFDWAKLWSYILPQIWSLLAAIASALVVAILNIQIPQCMGAVVNIIAHFSDKGNTERFFQEMKTPAIQLISMYCAQSLFTFFYIYLLSGIGEKIALRMKEDIFTSVIRQDISFYDVHRTGEIIHRLTNDIQDFKSSFKQCISSGLRSLTQIIGCGISLYIISPQMTIVTMLFIPSCILVGTGFGALLRNLSRRAQNQVEKTTAIAEEAISNIRTVRAFAMETQEQEMFRNESELVLELNQKLGLGIGMFQGATNLFLNGMVLGTLYMGGYLLSVEQLSPGQLMSFLMATQTIQRSLTQISLLFGSVVKGLAAGARVFEYIELKPTIPLSGGEIIPYHSLAGNIKFNNVYFSYPSRPEQVVLDNFNFEIMAGKTVALVGTSGNGKSTVVSLLERFYDVDDGSITLDGKDIRVLDPSWLRRRVLGFISQEPVLFATSVRENIRYGKLEASDEQVEAAAKLANAHEFIKEFPKGYDTVVGERGTALSGGQKQRIAIARALLKNPAVLILDEATSALDTESEKVVQTALEHATKNRTVLVIAHRLSTIENADLICVIKKGKIVEVGNHKELIGLKGYYWKLVQRQTKEEKERAAAA